MRYVSGQREPGCVFCNALEAGDDVGRLILSRGRRCFAILNLYPYNSGHAMVVPNEHRGSLLDLDRETRTELIELATWLVDASKTALRCDGLNIGLNIGEVAGAGVADHLHMHVVPRWIGDANFMPIIAGTTVMPELLPVTYARLRAELERGQATRERRAVAQAGALVVLPTEGLVALRRTARGEVVVPKGHIEPNETAADAALREIREEIGIESVIAGWAGSQYFDMPATPGSRDSTLRWVAYFLATGTRGADFHEHLDRDTLLVPIDQAANAISIPALRALVADATPALRRLAEAGAS